MIWMNESENSAGHTEHSNFSRIDCMRIWQTGKFAKIIQLGIYRVLTKRSQKKGLRMMGYFACAKFRNFIENAIKSLVAT